MTAIMRVSIRCAVVCAGVLIAVGCHQRVDAPKPQRVRLSRAATPRADLRRWLPAHGDLYLVADVRAVPRFAFGGAATLLAGVKNNVAATLAEVRKACLEMVGVDCSKPQMIAGYLSVADKEFGVILSGIAGRLRLPKTTVAKHHGVTLFSVGEGIWLAHRGRYLLMGSRAGVERLIRVGRGKEPSISAATTPLAAFFRDLDQGNRIVAVGQAPTDLAQSLKSFPKLAGLVVTQNGQIKVMAQGSVQELLALKIGAQMALATARAELGKELVKAKEKRNIFDTLAIISTRAAVDGINGMLESAIRDGRLTVEVKSGYSQIVMMSGILAVVAIPAFVRYMRKAKTSEALRMLHKIELGAFRYASRSFPDKNGVPQKCQFPPSVDWTPKGWACTNGTGKFKANEPIWYQPTWQALLFKMNDEHYYQYRFTRIGVGNGSRYVIEARGDLDCDGTYSTFRQTGSLLTSDKTETLNCRVVRATGVQVFNEAE